MTPNDSDLPPSVAPAVRSGEVVDAVPAGAVFAGGHVFAPVVLTAKGKARVVKLSQREMKFLNKLLGTGNIDLASHEVGIDDRTARRWLKRAPVRAFIDEQLEQAAFATGTTVNNNLAWLRKVRDGQVSVSRNQLDASKVISKILRPAGGPNVTVNQQFNGVSTVPNPYSGLSFDQVISETEERLASLKGRGPGTA